MNRPSLGRAHFRLVLLAAALASAIAAAAELSPQPYACCVDRRVVMANMAAFHTYFPVLVRTLTLEPPSPPAGSTAAVATASPQSAAPTATTSATPPTPRPTPPTPRPPDFPPVTLVRLAPQLHLAGSGTTIDSLAFWEPPAPASSPIDALLLLVTAKGNRRVEVWRWPFDAPPGAPPGATPCAPPCAPGGEQPPLQDPSFRAGSVVNGIVVDQDLDRAYVTVSRPASTIAVFALPGLEPLAPLVTGGTGGTGGAGAVDLRTEPNLAMLTLPDGAKRLYASADDHVYIFDPADGRALGGFPTSHSLEAMVADDVAQALYIPDETHHEGVYAYRPDGTPFERGGVSRFGGGGIFEADAEGIALYACHGPDGRDDGRGLIIVSDQKSDATDFETFDRRSWTHLGRIVLDGVSATDGIASTQRPLPGYPEGLFAAANDDREVVLVGWQDHLGGGGRRL
ncbi:MAG: phytase [Anaerolineae bacterium]